MITPRLDSLALSMLRVIETQPGITLIKFFKTDCKPCVTAGKVIDELQAEFGARVTFAAVNLTDHPSLAEGYDVDRVPFVVILADGVQVDFLPPLIQKTRLRRKLLAALGETD